MLRMVIALLFAFCMCIDTVKAEQDQVFSLCRVRVKSDTELQTLRLLPFELVYGEDGFVDAVVPSDQVDALKRSGLEFEVKIPDMSRFYRDRLAGKGERLGAMGGYRTLSEIYLAMDSIAVENPSIVQPKWSIGQTIEGRPIYVMKVSDNPGVDEDETEVYFNAAIHAREVITPELLIRFLRYLTDNYGSDPTVTDLVNSREMFFTLCQNPDGYYHNEVTDPEGGGMWRKNRRQSSDGIGVDLNRNYGYMWGFDDDGSSPDGAWDSYRGTGPFSEPETEAVRNFVLSRNFKVVVSYHSYANRIMWPWAFNCSVTPDENLLYRLGTLASQFNGYVPAHMCGINGASGDWYYAEEDGNPKIIEILVEVGDAGDGFWPALERITPLVEQNIMPSIFYARFAGDTSIVKPPAAPILVPIEDTVTLSPLVLHWSHVDNSNPAVSYDLWRYRGFQRLIDDIETTRGNWTENGFWRYTQKSHSGYYSYWGRDLRNTVARLTSTRRLSVQEGDSLTFWTWYDISEHWNYAYVEIQTDPETWIPLAGSITTAENPNGLNLGNGITGNSNGWVRATFDLGDYVGRTISFRFRYVTGDSVSPGFYVDDVYPIDRYDQSTQIVAGYSDTSISLSSLEDGDNYYQVFGKDAENQASSGSAIRKAVVRLWTAGDADANGQIDISDAVYVISFIFGGGPAPQPLLSGDADCSGGVDISDAVHLISYIFGGGPAPCAAF